MAIEEKSASKTKFIIFITVNGLNFNAKNLKELTNFQNLIKDYPTFLINGKLDADAYSKIGLMAGGKGLALRDLLQQNDIKQFTISDAENIALLTHYLNGLNDVILSHEEVEIVPYQDLQDDTMNQIEVVEKICKRALEVIKNLNYQFMALNIGSISQSNLRPEALKAIDNGIDKIIKKTLSFNGAAFILGGNIARGDKKSYTPLTIAANEYVGKNYGGAEIISGNIASHGLIGEFQDIAPTFLKVLNIEEPAEHRGNRLLC